MSNQQLRDAILRGITSQSHVITPGKIILERDSASGTALEELVTSICKEIDSVRGQCLHQISEPASLTDAQIDAIAEGMPGGVDGFLKGWGWRQFAREVLSRCTAPATQAAPAAVAVPDERAIRYDVLHEFAIEHRIDYNELCSAVRYALSAPIAATDERTAFEAWVNKDGGDLSTFGSGKNIHYHNSAVNNAWTGWQARAALAAAPAHPAEGVPAQGDWQHQVDEAATKHSDAYQGDDRQDIWTDVYNAFAKGADWERRRVCVGTGAAPQAPAADALDAARYRGMRDKLYGENISIGEATLIFKVTGNCPDISEFDAGIDAAIAAQAAAQGG